jgi:hypothetical protein
VGLAARKHRRGSGPHQLVEDPFFDAGGNSALLMRMHVMIERRSGRALPVGEIIELANVRELARRLAGGVGETQPERSAAVSEVAQGRSRLAELCRRNRPPAGSRLRWLNVWRQGES